MRRAPIYCPVYGVVRPPAGYGRNLKAVPLYTAKYSTYLGRVDYPLTMSALTRFFFRNEVTCRTPAEVIGWWEARRGGYNVAVGTAGLFTLAAVHLIALLPPGSVSIPWQPTVLIPLIYGVLANICYTGGWMAELWIRKTLGRGMEPVGPTLFRYGFAFSIGLTLFPIGLISALKALFFLGSIF